jgi:hypothetical protein
MPVAVHVSWSTRLIYQRAWDRQQLRVARYQAIVDRLHGFTQAQLDPDKIEHGPDLFRHRLQELGPPRHGHPRRWLGLVFDSIEIEAEGVPEPSTLALMLFGLLLIFRSTTTLGRSTSNGGARHSS